MPEDPSGAPRSPFNALHWIGGAAALVATIWWWDGFSGPVRWLIDLQVALTGRFYWEPLAVSVVLTGLLFVVVIVASALDRIVPRFKAKTWGWILLAAAILATAGGLNWAWSLWTAPLGATRQNPPLRVLDLDRLDAPTVPFGPVRLIGRADRRDQVRLRREPRGSHVYQPLRGLHRAARDMPVPVIAACYSRYSRDCIPEALEGWLYPGTYDDRESYRLRRAGVLRTPHFYMLSPGLPTGDSYVETSRRDHGAAGDILVCLGFFWLVVIVTWILAPPSSFPAKPAAQTAPPRRIVLDREANPFLAPLIAGAVVFIFLSVLGVVSWVIYLISRLIP